MRSPFSSIFSSLYVLSSPFALLSRFFLAFLSSSSRLTLLPLISLLLSFSYHFAATHSSMRGVPRTSFLRPLRVCCVSCVSCVPCASPAFPARLLRLLRPLRVSCASLASPARHLRLLRLLRVLVFRRRFLC